MGGILPAPSECKRASPDREGIRLAPSAKRSAFAFVFAVSAGKIARSS
jgi:hypothetical protein